jgi:hypothetical protein
MIQLNQKSVKSLNLYKLVILINYDTVKAHGGDLEVELVIVNTSTFIVRLPFSKNIQQ